MYKKFWGLYCLLFSNLLLASDIPVLKGALDLVFSLYIEIYSQLPSDKNYDMPKNLSEYYYDHLKQAVDYYPRAPN